MSQFQGSTVRVRCADCTKFSEGRCLAKDASVAARKRRTCNAYVFKGEFQNRTPLEAIYFPPVDKKTRKMIQKLISLGIVPVAGNQTMAVGPDGVPMVKQTVVVPPTTATADPAFLPKMATEKPVEEESNEQSVIWTPDSQE